MRQGQDGFIHESIRIFGRAERKTQRGILLRLGGGQQGHPDSTGTGGKNRFQNGLDGPAHLQRGSHSLADQQELVEFLQAGMQADAHLLEGAPDLADLIHALHREWMIQLALGNPPGFACQVLQRGSNDAEAEPQRNQRDDRQEQHEDSQRAGNIQR